MNSLAGTAFYYTGVLFVVGGGMVAAVTAPLGVYRGSWLAAYLVLVCGVAQAAIGRAQEGLPRDRVRLAVWGWQYACWNAGNALVILGTMRQWLLPIYLGSALLLGVIVMALWLLRNGLTQLWGWAYAAMLVVLLVSIPVGLLLAGA